jgi:maltose alpha-D-glucosyltransferase/alpha-amylase
MTFLDFLWDEVTSNLAGYLMRQRWFGGKTRPLTGVRLAEVIWLRSPPAGLALCVLECQYADGAPEFYSLLLGFVLGDRPSPAPAAQVILPRLITLAGPALVYDALAEPAACVFLLELFKLKQPLPARFGQLVVNPSPIYAKLRGSGAMVAIPMAQDQSNRTLFFGEGDDKKLLLKLFARLEPGINPEYEIAQVLTDETSFNAMPPLAGAITYQCYGQDTTLAVLFGYEQNEGTAWETAQKQLADLAAMTAGEKKPPEEERLAELLDAPIQWATKLGQRTGELHKALASVRRLPPFHPEPLGAADLAELVANLGRHSAAAADLWSKPAAQKQIRERLSSLSGQVKLGMKTRTHGDYHLGQALTRNNDFIIFDFEGEPKLSLAERRRKVSPLRDVAGMLRSFDYAASLFLRNLPGDAERTRLTAWARGWQDVLTQTFLHGYLQTVSSTDLLPADEEAKDAMLWLYTLEKALYEIRYEHEHRPDWLEVPREGLKALLGLKD